MDTVVEEIGIKAYFDGKQAEKGINNFIGTVQGGFKSLLTSAIMPLITTLATGQFLQSMATEMETIDRTSKSLRMSANDLYAWRNAADIAGVGANEMTGALKSLQGQMRNTALTRTGSIANWQRRGLLPDVLATNGALKDTETYLLEVADALSKLPADRAAIVAREIGLGNEAMQEFLRMGSAGIQKELARAREFAEINQKSIKVMRNMLKAIRELSVALKGLMLPIMTAVATVVTKLANLIILITQHIHAFSGAIAVLAGLVAKSLIPSFVNFFKSVIENPKTALLILILTTIGLIIEDIIVWLEGGESAFGDFYQSIANTYKGVKEFFIGIKNFFKGIGDAFESIKNIKLSDVKWMEFLDKIVEKFKSISWINRIIDFSTSIYDPKADGTAKQAVNTSAIKNNNSNTDNSQRNTNIVINGEPTDRQVVQAEKLAQDIGGKETPSQWTNQSAGAYSS